MSNPIPAPPKGITTWRRNGFCNARVHYSADPDKDPSTPKGKAWYDTVRQGYPSYLWDQEMEINFSVTPGMPVYCDTSLIKIRPQAYRPWLIVQSGLDFGRRMPGWVAGQIEPLKKEQGGGYRVRISRCIVGKNILAGAFADQHIRPDIANLYPKCQAVFYGDVAGNQHDDKDPESTIEIMAARDINVITRTMSINESIEIVQYVISAGWMEVDPQCRYLLDGFKSGYVVDEDGFPLKDGYYDHGMDAVRYWLANVFRIKSIERAGQAVKILELQRPVLRGGPAQPPDEQGGEEQGMERAQY